MANLGNTIINGILRVNGEILGNLTGNAATATKLATARKINGVAFDGTKDITISASDSTKLPLAGGTMTGTINTTDVQTNWIGGKTNAAIKYNGDNGIDDNGSAHFFYNMKSYGGNTLAFGGLNNKIGFYTYLKDRTDNGTDSSFICDTTTGNWSCNKKISASGGFSGALTGNASTASKLATARTIGTTGDVVGSGSFDGSGNLTFVTQRRGCYVGQSGTVVADKPWYKFAERTLDATYTDETITFKVWCGYADNSTKVGILTAHFRTNGNKQWESGQLVWEYANSGIPIANFVLAHNTATSPTKVELWVKCDISHQFYHFDVMSEGIRVGKSTNNWALYNTASAGSQASITSGYAQISSTLGTIINNVSSATKATQDKNGLQIDTGYLKLSGGTMQGDIRLKDKLVINDGVHNRTVLVAYDDGDGTDNDYGSEIVFTGNGNSFIGAGEAPKNLRTALKSATATGEIYAANNEQLFVASDRNIFFYSGANAIANRKGIIYDETGALRPLVNNTRTLGTSSVKWNNVYATTFTGALSGNATSATKATQDGDGKVIKSTYSKLDGTNYFVELTGGDGNTAGYRLVLQQTLGTWTNSRLLLSMASRHQGTGFLSLGLSVNGTKDSYYADIRYWGTNASLQDCWETYYNTSTGTISLFWKYTDYSSCRVSVLECSALNAQNIKNGTWMTSIDTSVYGTKLATKYNASARLETARTIGLSGVTATAQSFDGTKNIVIPITAVPASLLTGKNSIKASEINNNKHWVPSSDNSVKNIVAMTSSNFNSNKSSLANGTVAVITDGTTIYVTTQETSKTCSLSTLL